jgi:hypothetical protein
MLAKWAAEGRANTIHIVGRVISVIQAGDVASVLLALCYRRPRRSPATTHAGGVGVAVGGGGCGVGVAGGAGGWTVKMALLRTARPLSRREMA